MANLVSNDLVIVGPSAATILANLEKYGMDYYLPRPRYLDPDNAVRWGYDHWGTKWDMYKSQKQLTGSILHFITANGPADKFVMSLKRMIPENEYTLMYRAEDDGFDTVYTLFQDAGTWLLKEN
jgi:hypothetical protein